jgi:hypothetical protein
MDGHRRRVGRHRAASPQSADKLNQLANTTAVLAILAALVGDHTYAAFLVCVPHAVRSLIDLAR